MTPQCGSLSVADHVGICLTVLFDARKQFSMVFSWDQNTVVE